MADINQQTEELARLMEDVNRQMQQYGQVSTQTQQQVFDAQVQQKTGIRNATAAITSAGAAFGSVAKAGMAAAS
jgi:phage-related protein